MTSKSNKWVEHIKKYASENGMSYREAMRADGCKTAYKLPVDAKERSPSPPHAPRPPSPERLVSVPVKKGRGKKMLVQLPEPEPLPMPTLVRSEVETIPVVKKERVKRSPKMVPT
jgi:hypothetical protein